MATISDFINYGLDDNLKISPPMKKPYEALLESYFNDYSKNITYLGTLNKNRSSWWYMPLALKDRYGNSLQEHYQNIAYFEIFLRKNNTQKNELILFNLKNYYQKSLVKVLRNAGYKVNISLATQLRWLKKKSLDRYGRFCIFIDFIKGLINNIRFAQLDLSQLKDLEYIIFRPIHNLNQSNKYKDTYFGTYPSWLKEKGCKILITGPVAEPRENLQKVSRHPSWPNICIFEEMVREIDVIKIIFLAFREWLCPPIIYRNLDSKVPYLKSCLNFEIKDSLRVRLHSLMYESVIAYLLKQNPSAVILHTFENNSWEKAIGIAVKKQKKANHTVIGFMHCAVLESHTKLFMQEEDFVNRPMPDHILCTGPESKNALLKQGKYQIDKVHSGMALRESSLIDISMYDTRAKQRTLLVLLEGLADMATLLGLILDNYDSLGINHLLVRAHPTLPLSHPTFQRIRQHENFKKISVSKNSTLFLDLEKVDFVVYKGTTAALYAAYKGIPLIRFEDVWWKSDDPLKYCSSLKKKFTNGNELRQAIKYFSTVPIQSLAKERKKAKAYVSEYLIEPDMNKLDFVIKSLGH